METRANYVWVGAVTLLLLAAAGRCSSSGWRSSATPDRKEYDIFFKQSVGGLAKGSEVTFSGVPAGQVKEIELWRQGPRVRARARLARRGRSRSCRAPPRRSQAQLHRRLDRLSSTARCSGAPPITEPGPEGVPVIPTKPGGLGELLASAPLLLERLATLTDRLTRLLSDENQASISGILANTDRMSGQMADMGPEFRAALVELQGHAGAVDRDARRVRGHAALDRFAAQRRRPEPGRASCAPRCKSAQQRRDRARGDAAGRAARRRASWRKPRCRWPTPRCSDLRRTSQALRAVTEQIESKARAR